MDRNTRLVAILALVAIVQNATHALTGGPAMPEYAKFEQVGADNLVDPNSGNFTYVIPLIEVPGPGGSYPLSLSYQSGIQHGQEASWVGLGWTLNPGAINRMVRGVPDDYLHGVTTTWSKFSTSGEQINVNVGYGGFGMSMSFDANTGSMMGMTPSIGLPIPGPVGITLTPGGFNIGISHSIGLASASMSLYDSHTGHSGKPGWSVAGISGAKGVGVTSGAGKMTMSNIGVALPPISGFSLSLGYTKWKYRLNERSEDHMNGFLYQDANASGFVSQADYWPATSGELPSSYLLPLADDVKATPRQRFERNMMKELVFPSPDMFTLSANGLSGSFEPMVEPTTSTTAQSLPTYLDGTSATTNTNSNQGWKVDFPASAHRITFRMHGDPGGNLLQEPTANGSQVSPYLWDATTNSSGQKTAKPFGDQYGSQRIVPVFHRSADGSKVIAGRLKGFRIFNPDGMIYEFLQPLHNVLNADMVFENPTKATPNNSVKYMADKYAYTWLLTAVKGADYVSQSQTISSWEAVPAAGDLGHWVKFTYTDPMTTTFATPYSGNMPHEDADVATAGNLKYLKSFGVKEVAFLSSIETETHRADFKTETRLDNLPNRLNVWENSNVSPVDGLPNEALDHFVSARGVPRQKDYALETSISWSDQFEIPGDWVPVLNLCKQFHSAFICEGTIEAELELRLQKNGTFISGYKRVGGGTFISNIMSTENKNTRFTASVNMTYNDGSRVIWVRVKKAGVNWSRLYALIGSNVYFTAVTPATAPGAIPFVVNRALKSIELHRKGYQDLPGALVKRIDFTYDYSLCQKTPNSVGKVGGVVTNGKLTLKSVTTSGPQDHDHPGTMKPYVFTYQSGADGNPEFGNEFRKDIWGMHKADGALNNHLVTQPATPGSGYPQGTTPPGVAWNLVEVKTPTGGSIKVTYDRDQYWAGGVGTEPSSAKHPFVMPDLYHNAPPQKPDGDLDVSQMLTLAPSNFHRSDANANQREPVEVGVNRQVTMQDMAAGTFTNNAGLLNLRKYPETTPNHIKFAQASPGVIPGDILMVVYQLDLQKYSSYNWTTFVGTRQGAPEPLTTGVLNFLLVEDVNSNGYKVKPLMASDASGNFFVYKDLTYQKTGTPHNYEYKYYVHNFNRRHTIYGGDVVVMRIDLEDGLGNTLTKKYEYDARDIRSGAAPKGIATACAGCGVSSGATFGMPSLYWSKYYRFIPAGYSWNLSPRAGMLRLESYYELRPSFAETIIWRGYYSPKIVDDKDNPVKVFLDEAYFADSKDGGVYWPSPGINYARAREFYAAQADGRKVAGETEYQFQGLNHTMANESGTMGSFNNLVSGIWNVASTTTPRTLTVANAWASKKGALVRMLKRSNANGAVVASEEMKYAGAVTTYGGPNAGDIKNSVSLGLTRQTFVSSIGGTNTTITVDHPAQITVGKTQKENGVPVETDYLAFDPRTGEPLAVQKTGSDGVSFVDYQEPAYWSLDDLALRNRFKLAGEERKYQLAAGQTFSRTDFDKVVGATKSVWTSEYNGYWKKHATLSGKLRPPIKTEEYVWSQTLKPDGLPVAAYTPFTGSASSTWLKTKSNSWIWRNGQPIQIENGIGEKTLMIPSPMTGHPMAMVSGAAYNEVIVSTLQFKEDDNSRFDGHDTWGRIGGYDDMHIYVTPFTTASWRIEGGSTRTRRVYLKQTGEKGLRLSVFAWTPSAGCQIKVYPLTQQGGAVAGTSPFVYDIATSITPTASATPREFDLDWSGPAYANAGMAEVQFIVPPGATLYLTDLRVTPPGALVKTYYYEPRSMNLRAVLDEGLHHQIHDYDPLGRLVEKHNSLYQLIEKTRYLNYQD